MTDVDSAEGGGRSPRPAAEEVDGTAELLAGVTTFMTMGYILFVNASILGSVADRDGHKLAFGAVLTSTALAAAISSALMGAFARYPFALAAGMGLNAVVTYQLVATHGLTWAEAMGVVVVEGLLITILVLAGLREMVMRALPDALKKAIGAGIGLFLCFIGLVTSGFVGKPAAPTLRVELGTGGVLDGAPVMVFVFGLLLTIVLLARKIPGALLIGIVTTTIVAVAINELAYDGKAFAFIAPGTARVPSTLLALPDAAAFSQVGAFSFGFFTKLGALSAALAIVTLMLGDFFDTMGTVVGLGARGGFIDKKTGELPRLKRVLLVDSVAAIVGGALGCSSNTTYIESASGIGAGGRTGRTAIVVAICFLLSIVLWPLADVVPPHATAPALVVTGALMIGLVKEIDWDDPSAGVPAFLTLTVMPFTYSITNGIGAGLIGYVVVELGRGRWRTLHPAVAVSAVLFAIYFVAR